MNHDASARHNACVRYLNGRSEALQRRLDAADPEEIVVCSIVEAELFYGAAKSRWPEKTLARQLSFLARFRSLPFDSAAAKVYGPVRRDLENSGQTIGANDLLIAAIALANALTIVTHNTGEFDRIRDIQLEDWEFE